MMQNSKGFSIIATAARIANFECRLEKFSPGGNVVSPAQAQPGLWARRAMIDRIPGEMLRIVAGHQGSPCLCSPTIPCGECRTSHTAPKGVESRQGPFDKGGGKYARDLELRDEFLDACCLRYEVKVAIVYLPVVLLPPSRNQTQIARGSRLLERPDGGWGSMS